MNSDQPADSEREPHNPDAFDDSYDRGLRADYGEGPPPPERPRWRPPERTPGFGFWMAVLWCLLYLVATQIIAGIVFGIPIIGIALIPEIQKNGMGVLNDPAKLNAWMVGPDGRVATLLLVSATQFAGLALSLLLLRLSVGKSWKRKIALTRPPSALHFVLILIGMPAMLAVAACVEAPIERYVPSIQQMLDALGIDFKFDGSETLIPLLKFSPLAVAIFAVAISPAICEEVFCRGFIAQGLAGRYRTWAVVLMTSFLFGCLHMDPRQGLGAMLLGAAIHFAYVATRSLWAPMFVHFANNGTAVVHFNEQANLPVLAPMEELLKRSPELFVPSAVLFFAAVAYALYQTRCRLSPIDPELPVWEPKGVSSAELPPPGSNTAVTHDPISLLSVGLILVGAIQFGCVLAFA